MSAFSADWLALREPADHAARSATLARAIGDRQPHAAEMRVLDLGAGTGSNMRYLAGHLSRWQHWLLVDHDPALLSSILKPSEPSTCRVETRQVDLAKLAEVTDARIFDGRVLVTASALLDLVSEEWLRGLTARCHEIGAAVLFALSYDGRIHFTPEDRDDELVRGLVNRHQRTDKGFGPALGPDATDYADRMLAGLGYQVQRARSDWLLTPQSRELQCGLIGGWAQAAAAIEPAHAASIEGWRARRLERLASGRSELIVGHEDLAAWIPNS
jgi:hypothetical protein